MPDETLAAAATAAAPPTLRRLVIERFRGVQSLTWYPAEGVNVILGGGDTGKTTILEAIALLLSPTNANTISDTDYWQREPAEEFSIEGIFSLPDGSGVNQQLNPAWPWQWDGQEPKVPELRESSDEGGTGETVYRVRVRGTAEMELVYELLQPDSTVSSFSVSLRRAIGLVRLSGEDRNDRDLRLIQGSALDRLLSDASLRSRLAEKMSDTDVGSVLKPEAKEALEKLDEEFQKRVLPTGLALGLAGGQGFSIGALIGLTAKHADVDLPLASWGSGTRRLSALAIAEQHKVASPITLVDEIERGLEPYRQRSLVKKLESSPSQIFLTTHSTIVLAATADASIWYVDATGKIGQLDAQKTRNLRQEEPEAFLARFTIVAEGATEVGFVTYFLEKALAGSPEDHGIYIADGNGNEAVLELLKAMDKAGLAFGGFADDEGKSAPSWQELKTKIGSALFQWPTGCIEQHVFAAVPAAKLTDLFKDSDGATGLRLRTMQERLNTDDKLLATIVSAAGANLLDTMVRAASGYVPPETTDKEERKRLKNHATHWFKSYEGGRELAEKVVQLGAWPTLKPKLMPFLNAIRKVAGLSDIEDLAL